MANRFLGEISVKDGGETFTLRCDFNAMCAFEDATGENALDVFAAVETGNVKVTHLRAMMWAFLQYHHPEIGIGQAGDILGSHMDALGQVIEAASPESDEAEVVGNGKKRKAKAA